MSDDRLTERQAVILSAYTGVLVARSFAPVHAYIETLLARPVLTHELASEDIWATIRERAEDDMRAIGPEAPTDE